LDGLILEIADEGDVVGDEGVDEVGDEMTGGDVICCSDGSLDWEM